MAANDSDSDIEVIAVTKKTSHPFPQLDSQSQEPTKNQQQCVPEEDVKQEEEEKEDQQMRSPQNNWIAATKPASKKYAAVSVLVGVDFQS